MSAVATLLLQLNLWAVVVWAAAAFAARRAPALGAWPAYWVGAVVVILAPSLLAAAAPAAFVETALAGLGEFSAAALSRAMAWAYEQSAAAIGVALPAAESAPMVPAFDTPVVFTAPLAESAPAIESARFTWLRLGWLPDAAAIAAALYGIVALGCALRRLGAHARIRILARRAAPLHVAHAPYPAVVTQADLPPCALGFPAPVIVIPASLLARLEDNDLAMILRHEAAHIRNRDPETTFALGLVEALFWPNPAMRHLVSRWRLAAEIAADEAVSAGQPQPLRARYARLLVSALRGWSGGAALPAPSAALRLDRKGGVKLRLSAILHAPEACGAGAKLAAMSAGAALVCAGALGAAAFAQAPDRTPVQTSAQARNEDPGEILADIPAPQSLSPAPAPVAAPAPLAPIAEPSERAEDIAAEAATLLAQIPTPPAPRTAPPAPPAPPAPMPTPAVVAVPAVPPAVFAFDGCDPDGERIRVIVERTAADGTVTREESESAMPDRACIEAQARAAREHAAAMSSHWAEYGRQQGEYWGQFGAMIGQQAALQAQAAVSAFAPGMSEADRAELQADLEEARAEIEAGRAEWEADRAEWEADWAAEQAEWEAEQAQIHAEIAADLAAEMAENGREWGDRWGDSWSRSWSEIWDGAPGPDGVPAARILEGGPRE